MTAETGASPIRVRFNNRLVRELPPDPIVENRRRQVQDAIYSRVVPTPVAKPTLVATSREVAENLGFTPEFCESDEFAEVFAGNRLLEGMDPHATCYGGHQFGHWAGQLGDGRAINLGEVVTPGGEHLTLQLKGAGPTPYSRTADGLAVLRSSVREFLCSEAMFHLGVPTTRALSLVLTGEEVVRDMFYDGNPELEAGAVVCRVAPSFTRFGHFEIWTARDKLDILKQLVEFTIRTDFPELGEPSPLVYITWFEEVCRRTANMVVEWLRVGFVHGVMNTDNMSILGLTIDYGPYGWLENYDPNWTPNTTDASHRRYRFGDQHNVAAWNLAKLAEAIYPLVQEVKPLQAAMQTYASTFQEGWRAMMAAKLGFKEFDPSSDETLVTELLDILALVETDMTIFYRRLAETKTDMADFGSLSDEAILSHLADAYYLPEQQDADYTRRAAAWMRLYVERLLKDAVPDAVRGERMNGVNPKYVLRNYLAQLAIDKAQAGDFSGVNDLLDVLRYPYDEQPERETYAAKRPDWARSRAGCSMLSCSS